jgi:protein-serine/threonine kinase
MDNSDGRRLPNFGRDSDISPDRQAYLSPQSHGHGAQPSHPHAHLDPASKDPTHRLVHQFSNQYLGDCASTYGARQPSPANQRPRTAGTTGRAAYSLYLSAHITSQQSWLEFRVAPERNPDKFGPVAQNNQKKCERLASDFFKDSVKRARDRKVR